MTFKIVAFTPDNFEKLIYMASEKQVHLYSNTMKEKVSDTSHCAGLVLDPNDYPEGTRFLVVLDKQ